MRSTVLLVAVLACACSTATSELRAQLDARAADYLKCNEKRLEYTELDKLISTTKVRVSGCGKSVTYTLVESRWEKTPEQPHH